MCGSGYVRFGINQYRSGAATNGHATPVHVLLPTNYCACRNSGWPAFSVEKLLLLLDVDGVASQPRTVFLQFQLLTAGATTDGVVVIAGLFTHQKHGDDFLLALGHSQFSAELNGGLVNEDWGL